MAAGFNIELNDVFFAEDSRRSDNLYLDGNYTEILGLATVSAVQNQARHVTDLMEFAHFMSSQGRKVLTKLDQEFFEKVKEYDLADAIPDFADPCEDSSCAAENKECVVYNGKPECTCDHGFGENGCLKAVLFVESLEIGDDLSEYSDEEEMLNFIAAEYYSILEDAGKNENFKFFIKIPKTKNIESTD